MTPPCLPRLRRPEEETPAGGAGDGEPASGQAALPGRLLPRQRGALPRRPLRPRPQGAPLQEPQAPADGPGRHEGRGGRERCLNDPLSGLSFKAKRYLTPPVIFYFREPRHVERRVQETRAVRQLQGPGMAGGVPGFYSRLCFDADWCDLNLAASLSLTQCLR